MKIAIERRLDLGFGLALAILIAIGFFSYRNAQEQAHAGARVAHTHDVIAKLEELRAFITDAESCSRGYIITENVQFLEFYHQALAEAGACQKKLRQLTADNQAQQERLSQLETVINDKLAMIEKLIALVRDGNLELAREAVRTERGRTLMSAIRTKISILANSEHTLLAQRARVVGDDASLSIYFIGIGTAFAILLVLLARRIIQREILARTQKEKKLEESLTLQNAILDSANYSIIAVDPMGVVCVFNKGAERMLQYSSAETIGVATPSLFHDPALVRQRADQLASVTGSPVRNEFEVFVHQARKGLTEEKEWIYIRKDGTRFPVTISVTALRDGSGEISGFLGIGTDITERKRSEQRLATQYEIASALADSAPVDEMLRRILRIVCQSLDWDLGSFWELDRQRQVLRWMTTWRRDGDEFTLFEEQSRISEFCSGVGLPGRVWRSASSAWIEDVLLDSNYLRLEAARATRLRGAFAFPIILNGEVLGVIDFLSKEVRRPDEELLRLFESLGSQIGQFLERKRAENRLRQSKDDAELANRSKSDFLANMSHELRTPLNSVIGFTNILLKNKAQNLREQDVTYLARILDNGKHLLGLINNILDLSKIEAGKMEPEFSAVSIEELVKETLGQMEGRILGGAVKLYTDVPEGLPPLVTDPGMLKQVLINLVGNALKFTEHGSVTVRVYPNPFTQVPLRLDVIDTGIGIPLEKQKAIFEAFQQADNTTSRRFGGTGLGLTISRALSELLHYRLSLASTIGAGTTFTIHFAEATTSPLSSQSDSKLFIPPKRPEVAIATPAALLRQKVLVIDDASDSRLLLSQYFEDFGCTVVTAASGEQGLRHACEFLPDLITLDLMMPRMNGWETLRALKADPRSQHIPVVIVSIVATENRDPELGAVDFLNKPVTREALLAVLRREIRPLRAKVLLVAENELVGQRIRGLLSGEELEIRTVAGLQALESITESRPDIVVLDLTGSLAAGAAILEDLSSNIQLKSLPVVVLAGDDLSSEDFKRLGIEGLFIMRKSNDVEGQLARSLRGILKRLPVVPRQQDITSV